MDPTVLAFQFGLGGFVLPRNLEGLSQEDSVQRPQPGGNTLNWIVGHIVRTRNQALGLLGAEPLFDDTEFEAYGAGRSGAPGPLALAELTRRFDALGPALADALNQATTEQLSAPAPFSPSGNPHETVGTLLASIAFHEAYHLGQTGVSRRLLGRAGALLAPGEQGHHTQSSGVSQ